MQPLRGIALKILSVVVFIGMATIVKSLSATIPPGEAVFFRSFFSMPVIVVWMMWTHEFPRALKTTMPMGHVWRGVIGTTSMSLGFAAAGLLSFPEWTVIGYASPILTVIFGAMFLGEQIRVVRLTAVALGMIGVVIVMSPRLTIGAETVTVLETLGAVLALGGAVFGALAQVQVRKLVATEHTAAIVFYFLLTATILSLFTIPWGWVVPSPSVFGLLVLSGILGGVGQILLTSSYRYADAGVVAPFEYVSILFALIIGYFLFSEVPTKTMLLGAIIIIAAGVLIIWRERQLGLERAKQKAAGPQGPAH